MTNLIDSYIPAVNPATLPQVKKTEFYKGSSSTWGQTIPCSAGIRRMPSYKIWLQGYRTFTLGALSYASFAVSFGYPLGFNPNSRRVVKAIWADGRLVWQSATGAISSNEGEIGTWRFYPGTEDQLIDPLMEADHPGFTPAYRGQMIMVHENFPLYYFNEHVPSISAEIWDEDRLDNTRMPMIDELMLFANRSGAYNQNDFDIDDALLDIENDGIYVDQNMTFKQVLDVYAKFYNFDYCESQGTIKLFRAVNAGSYDVTAVLTTSDLMSGGSGGSAGGSDQAAILTTRSDAAQVPITQTVQYRDRTQQYQMSIQRARRPQFPQVSILGAGGSDDFVIPIIVTASEAMTGATRALYRSAHEREQHAFQLPPNFMSLEPGDIVQIEVGGKTYIAKLNKVEVQSDLSIKCNAVNVARGSDYAINGFAGGVQNWLVQRAVRVGGYVNSSVINELALTEV